MEVVPVGFKTLHSLSKILRINTFVTQTAYLYMNLKNKNNSFRVCFNTAEMPFKAFFVIGKPMVLFIVNPLKPSKKKFYSDEIL